MSEDSQQGAHERAERDRPEVAAWKAAYRELDNSALLALVPVLVTMIEEAKRVIDRQADHESRSYDTTVAFTAGHLEHAMRLQERGVDVSEYVGVVEAVSDDNAKSRANGTKRHNAMLLYSSDLMIRQRWILNVELRRRGLLADPDHFLPPELRPRGA